MASMDNVTSSVDVERTMTSEVDAWTALLLKGKIRPLSDTANVIIGVYLTIVGVLATVGNFQVLVIIVRSKKLRRKPHNMLLVNMAAADLFISIFGYPFTTVSGFARRFIFGMGFCVAQGFLTFLFALCAMNTLAALSFYRYMAVCKPHKAHVLTVWRTWWVILGLWIYALLITGAPLVGWSSYTFEVFGVSCTIDWTNPNPSNVAYVIFLIFSCYLLHISLMAFCYVNILLRARKLHVTSRAVLDINSAVKFQKLRGEVKVSVMSMIMVTSFTLVWSPYAILSLWSVFDPNLPNWVIALPTMFAKLSTMLNPFIYALTNPHLQVSIFKCMARSSNKVAQGEKPKRFTNVYTVDRTKEGIYIGKTTVQVSTATAF